MPEMLYIYQAKQNRAWSVIISLLFILHSLLLMASKADVLPLKMEQVVKTSGYKMSVVITQLTSVV